jgi:hypothetical protein
MKKLLLALIPALLISASAIVPSVNAQSKARAMPSMQVTMQFTLTPFNLAYLAHQGAFVNKGIPSFDNLMTEYRSGRFTAKNLVEKAVSSKTLPSSFLTDESYISAVETQLYAISLAK